MRVVLCKYVIDRIGGERNAQRAVEDGLYHLDKKTGGKAGLICIDKDGNYGLMHNTKKMAVAYADIEDGSVKAFINVKNIFN
jgi:beta-aspartyl-peptidase (threonine type)